MGPINRIGRRAGAGLVLVSALVGFPVHAADLYFVDIFVPTIDDGSIRKVTDDGTNLQTLVPTGGGLRAVDVDLKGGKIYWADANNPGIRRANLDGSNQEDLVTENVVFPSALDVDVEGGKIYWGDQLTNQIWRANLDGSNPEPIVDTAFHRGIAVDSVNGKLYWSTSISAFRGDIWRSDLDGSNMELAITSRDAEFKPSTVAVDPVGGKIYWNDYVLDVVARSNLDGSGLQYLYIVGANHNTRGVGLDLDAGKIYWGQDIDFDGTGGKIMRMNLNGSNPELVLDGLGLVNYLAVVPESVCPGDVSPDGGDGSVDVNDLLAVIGEWGPCALPPCAADVNDDGVIDVDDLLAVIAAWGVCP